VERSGILVFPTRVGELAGRRFKMETLHIGIETKVTEETQAHEIKKILVIDNDKDSALSTGLTQEKYHVVHCDSVQKAWGLVYPHRPHLIILRLYNSNGAALAELQECRALAEGVPIVVAVSGHLNPTLVKALQHGAAAVLPALSTPESIRGALRGLMRR
jgi:DNA-binding NtrC family response regulator